MIKEALYYVQDPRSFDYDIAHTYATLLLLSLEKSVLQLIDHFFLLPALSLIFVIFSKSIPLPVTF